MSHWNAFYCWVRRREMTYLGGLSLLGREQKCPIMLFLQLWGPKPAHLLEIGRAVLCVITMVYSCALWGGTTENGSIPSCFWQYFLHLLIEKQTFFEKFYVYRKIEPKAHKDLYIRPHHPFSMLLTSCISVVHLYDWWASIDPLLLTKFDSLHWVYSLCCTIHGFWQIHNDIYISIILNDSSTALNVVCTLLIYPFLPLNFWQPLIFLLLPWFFHFHNLI